MDETERAIIKASVEVALAPIAQVVSDVLGLAGGDWVSEKHKQNREQLKTRFKERLAKRKVEAPDTSPSIAMPIVIAAQQESREELLDLWAALLAAACDPRRARRYRSKFFDIVRGLDPIDAYVLSSNLHDNAQLAPHQVAASTKLTKDIVEASLNHLVDLDVCLLFSPGDFRLTALGREFRRVVMSDDAPE